MFDFLKQNLSIILFFVVLIMAVLVYIVTKDIKFDKKEDNQLIKIVTVEAYDP